MIDAKQLLSFFEAEYAQDVEADEIKKGISDELKAYAENIEVSPKSIKTAFSLCFRISAKISTRNSWFFA